jgi:glycosyltransferase involved in cell wall biosynthesis
VCGNQRVYGQARVKIAILDHSDSSGGISRFVEALALNLSRNHPESELSFFANAEVVERDSLKKVLGPANVNVVPVQGPKKDRLESLAQAPAAQPHTITLKIKGAVKSIPLVKRSFKAARRYWQAEIKHQRPWYDFRLDAEVVKRLEEYDVVYLSTPMFIQPFRISKPIVCTFHDFNWKHNFTGNFNPDMLATIEKETRAWMKIYALVVTSTRFIQKELLTYYPNKAAKRVIYLPALSGVSEARTGNKGVVKKFGLPEKFVLFPGNISTHKNLPRLIRAAAELKGTVPLVISGLNTDKISASVDNLTPEHALYATNKALMDSGLELGKNIFALGYVSNEDMNGLLETAQLVVSPSLYEAGSGPGLDAWTVGTPVAMSNIEPFMEQLEVLGTKAWVFDPKDPHDIAAKITAALRNPKETAEMVRVSREQMRKRTWADVADEYFEAFEAAVKGAHETSRR